MKNITKYEAEKLLNTELTAIRGGGDPGDVGEDGCKKCDQKCVRRRK